jgi:rhodanese-related sulfurtransferase
MKFRFKPPLLLLSLSVIIALIANAILSNRIPYFGNWPSISGSDTVAIPPSAEEGDPPFISLDEAATEFQSKDILFIDAREPEDYDIGHIKGAINLPYDYLEDYWDKVTKNIPLKQKLVVYCSGSECESSLFLGREMADKGYLNVHIFYGGWREWKRSGLPIEGKQ